MKTHLAWRWEPGRSATHPAGRLSQRGLERVRKWTATVQLPPNQSCGRFEKQQQGGCTPAGRVGGDTLCCGCRLLLGLTALCVIWRAWLYPCAGAGLAIKASRFGGTWGRSVIPWHSYMQAYYSHARKCQMVVRVFIPCLMSDRTLIRSRHHLSLSPPSIIDADQFFSLKLSISLGMPLFLSPQHDLFWLPDVFLCSLLWSFGGEAWANTPFAHFCGCFGQHTVGPGPRSHAGRE